MSPTPCSPARLIAPRRTLRTLLLVGVVSTALSCETIERVAPYLVVAGGAIASVVALNYLGDCGNEWAGCVDGVQAAGYAEQVLVMIGTLTTVAGVGADYWSEKRQEARELARLEDVQAQIERDYQQAQSSGGQGWGSTAGAQGWAAAPQSGPARWGTAFAPPQPGGPPPSWQSAAPQPAGGPPPDPSAAQAPWDGQYVDNSWQGKSGDPNSPLSLGVALMKRVVDTDGVRGIAIANGDVLFDGVGENFADRFRLVFSPDDDSFVYVVGVDAVGRVQPLYPRVFPDATNPVRAGERILLPSADEWYGLDSFEGLQHIYFYASKVRNRDIERQLTIFASKPPPDPAGRDGRIYSVSSPTLPDILQARGITGTEAGEVTRIPAEDQEYEVTLEPFHALPGRPLMAARYFDHQ